MYHSQNWISTLGITPSLPCICPHLDDPLPSPLFGHPLWMTPKWYKIMILTQILHIFHLNILSLHVLALTTEITIINYNNDDDSDDIGAWWFWLMTIAYINKMRHIITCQSKTHLYWLQAAMCQSKVPMFDPALKGMRRCQTWALKRPGYVCAGRHPHRPNHLSQDLEAYTCPL